MPTLSFEGETQDEIVRKVRRWLASLNEQEDQLSVAEAIERASELTKDALTVIAQAPGPLSRTEMVKALTKMGYEITDATKDALISSIDTLSDATEGSVIHRIQRARNSVLYEMNSAVAKQLLRSLTSR